jgi:hypothetical protein
MATHSMIRGLVLSGISLENTITYRERSPFPENVEIIIEHEHARDNSDSLMIIMNCINLVDDAGCMMARHLKSA